MKQPSSTLWVAMACLALPICTDTPYGVILTGLGEGLKLVHPLCGYCLCGCKGTEPEQQEQAPPTIKPKWKIPCPHLGSASVASFAVLCSQANLQPIHYTQCDPKSSTWIFFVSKYEGDNSMFLWHGNLVLGIWVGLEIKIKVDNKISTIRSNLCIS